MSKTYSSVALEKGIKATFLKYLGTEDPAIVNKLCEIVPSDSDNEKHEWLGEPPSLSAHEGEVKVSGLSSTSITINNVVYDGAILASVDDIRRNKTNSILKRAQQLAIKAKGHTVKTLMELIEANSNCYDASAMFGNSHTARKDSGTQDNNLAITGSTVANIQTDIALAQAAMLGFLDESGDPFHGDASEKMEFMIVAAPNLKYTMDVAIKAQVISQTSNVNQNIASVFYSPRITASSWYLFRTDMFKPFIFQPELGISMTEDTSKEKSHRQKMYICDMAYGMGMGFWQSAIKVA